MNIRYYIRSMCIFTIMMSTFAYAHGQTIAFRHGSEVIHNGYKENQAELDLITSCIEQNLAEIQSGKIVVNITAVVSPEQKSNPAATSLASLRGATVRQWLTNNFPTLKEGNFSYGIDYNKSSELVQVECLETNIITKNNKIYFRRDKDNVDPTYLTNAHTLLTIDSIMNRRSAEYIDTLIITAFASPEGTPAYNQNLSERRAESLRQYLLRKYPKLSLSSITSEGKGENWEGFRRLAEADPNLPRKEEILSIIDNPNINIAQRQARIVNLNGGDIYRDYIYPKYYTKLRSGASLFVIYNLAMPKNADLGQIIVTVEETPEIDLVETKPESDLNSEFKPIGEDITIELDEYRYIRPFALKTNLLFDAATLFNIELEVPIGNHFSVLSEWTFPFWGGLGNRGGVAPVPLYSDKYTLQMLSGGVELRYWFNRSDKLNNKAQRWGDYNSLCGWFVGPYAGYGMYDFQLGKDGVQSDSYMSAGISGGFAHPIGKHLHMEYSVGVGYMQTQYKHYTPIDGHKVYEYDGKYTWIGPTKAKISLVWIPRFKVNNNQRGDK